MPARQTPLKPSRFADRIGARLPPPARRTIDTLYLGEMQAERDHDFVAVRAEGHDVRAR